MTRHTAAVASHSGFWSQFGQAARIIFRLFATEPAADAARAALESEQARIRRTSRHWLIG